MLSFDEKLRLKTLISDTVILLCKNGLVPKLKGEFVIEGLIGISLERDDLMLVRLNSYNIYCIVLRHCSRPALPHSQAGRTFNSKYCFC